MLKVKILKLFLFWRNCSAIFQHNLLTLSGFIKRMKELGREEVLTGFLKSSQVVLKTVYVNNISNTYYLSRRTSGCKSFITLKKP